MQIIVWTGKAFSTTGLTFAKLVSHSDLIIGNPCQSKNQAEALISSLDFSIREIPGHRSLSHSVFSVGVTARQLKEHYPDISLSEAKSHLTFQGCT